MEMILSLHIVFFHIHLPKFYLNFLECQLSLIHI